MATQLPGVGQSIAHSDKTDTVSAHLAGTSAGTRKPQAAAGTAAWGLRVAAWLGLYGLLDRGDGRPVGQEGEADRSGPGVRVDRPPPAAYRVAAALQARQVRGVHAAAGVDELDLDPGVAEPADQPARGVGALNVLHVKAAAVDFAAEVG